MELIYAFGIFVTILFILSFVLAIIATITDDYLLKKIKVHPEQRDNLIDSYWAKDFLDSDFYDKCKTPSEKFQQELEDLYDDAYDINDFIAVEKYSKLSIQRKKIDKHKAKIEETKRQHENSLKMEVLVNQSSQALDDVWD